MSIVADKARKKFTRSEDDTLKRLVDEYGSDQWLLVAAQMPGRNVRQCRERWKHYVSGDKLWQPWTQAEDDVLRGKVALYGLKWTKVARFLRGRTDLEVKTQWWKLSKESEKKEQEGRKDDILRESILPVPVTVVEGEQTAVDRPETSTELDWFNGGLGWIGWDQM